MKLTFPLALILLISFSCKSDVEEKATAEIVNDTAVAAPTPVVRVEKSKLQNLKGTFIGRPNATAEFVRARLSGVLNFTITKIDEEKKTISGYRLTEGKKKSFITNYEFDKTSNRFVLTRELDKTPLYLQFDKTSDFLVMTVGKLERTELRRHIFKYDATLQISEAKDHPSNLNASTTKLTESQLEDLKWRELNYIKNAIYARHGKAFTNSRNIFFFENNVNWYAPLFLDVDNKLTELEKENIILLEKFEKLVPNPNRVQQ